jgi:putative flippase GtrA
MKSLINKLISGEFFRFVLVGGLSALMEYALYFLFKSMVEYKTANIIAFACTNVVTYILTRRYVFTSGGDRKTQEAFLFVLCLAGALVVNQWVFIALVESASMDDRIAKVVAIAVTVIWNFFTRKHIVFKNRETVTQEARTKDF